MKQFTGGIQVEGVGFLRFEVNADSHLKALRKVQALIKIKFKGAKATNGFVNAKVLNG